MNFALEDTIVLPTIKERSQVYLHTQIPPYFHLKLLAITAVHLLPVSIHANAQKATHAMAVIRLVSVLSRVKQIPVWLLFSVFSHKDSYTVKGVLN